MKRITLFLCSILAVSTLMAVPASKKIKSVQQPDGSTLLIQQHGDEHAHFTTTADGYLVKNVDGRYEYAQTVRGEVIPLGIAAQNAELRTAEITSRLSEIGTFSLEKVDYRERVMKSPRRMDAKPFKAETVGERGLVILVEFKDVKFKRTRQEFDNLLNQENYTLNGVTGSAHDYFKTASNGQYNPKFDVFGPYTLPNNTKYYGENDSRYDQDLRPDQMVVDVVNLLAADKDAGVNFADYDTDGDGFIDNVFVYYAGYGENQTDRPNDIWPHRWVVSPEKVENLKPMYNGKVLYDYACTCELKGTYGSDICGVGTFCHEFSHVLGLPDLYPTGYTDHKTQGMWDLMDYGSYNNDEDTPPTYSAYERFFVGWLTPEVLRGTQEVELKELQSSNSAYVITKDGEFSYDPYDEKQEFYILENRQSTGWDAHLPGHGMLVTKVRYNDDKWFDNEVNNDEDNMYVDLIEADGKNKGLDYYTGVNGKAGDAFPGSENVTTFSPYSNAKLQNIREEGLLIKFAYSGPGSNSGTAVGNETADVPALVKNADNTARLINIPVGALISCIDFMGRTLYSGEAATSTVELPDFNTPAIVKIVYNNNVNIFKNL